MDKNINILVVDDEEEILTSFKRYFLTKGYNISVCSRASEALKKIKDENYHIVITDINMPEIDGIELLKRIKSLGQLTHVIMITAYSTMDRVTACLEYGAEDFIVKPFEDFDIIEEIIEAAAKKHARWIKGMKDTCKG